MLEAFSQTEYLFANLKKRSVIGFFGNSGAGKSTLINTVVGDDILPTGGNSPTPLVTLVGHTEYKPPSLFAEVALFKRGFSPHMIHDPDHVAGTLLEQGGTEILSRGEDAYFAVVFCGADICRHVWLMDTPGDIYGAGGDKVLLSAEIANGFVLLSRHSHFLCNDDLGLLANVIRRCAPLKAYQSINHMLFVQSHCAEVEFSEIRAVFEDAVERVKNQLCETAFEFLNETGLAHAIPGEEELAARVQPFWRENEHLASQTVRRVKDMAAYLSLNDKRIAEDDIERALNWVNRVFHNAIDVSEAIQYTVKKASQRSEDARTIIDQFQSSKVAKVANSIKDLSESCGKKKSYDMKVMNNHFDLILSEEFLCALIEQNFADEKDARKRIGSYIGQMLLLRFESVLERNGKAISDEVAEMLSEWRRDQPSMRSLHILPGSEDPDSDYEMSVFDPRMKFIEGLRGAETLGAMSFYIKSFIVSNIGQSVLAGDADGYRISLGLAKHNKKVASFAMALGRSMTMGLASTRAIGCPDQDSGDGFWQKALAADVMRQMSVENIRAEFERTIDDFWSNTEKAIALGFERLRSGSDEYLELIVADISREYTESEIDAYRWTVRKASDFFSPEAPAKMGRAVLFTSIILTACALAFVVLHFHDYNLQGGFLP